MKKSIKSHYIISLFFGCALMASLNSCKDDDESAKERAQRLLTSATWQLSRLTVDGTDRTALYQGMTISVSANVYSAVGGEPVWPGSGTWKLNDARTIDRDNGVIITIDALTETKLTLSMEWTATTYGQGRSASVGGHHVFELKKK